MSGPSLKQLHAHRSIHDGAFSEGKNLINLLGSLYAKGQMEHTKKVAEAIIEHWETRTLAHAQAEEEGFYQELADRNPDLAEKITKFKRDHDLIRILVEEMKELLAEGVNDEVLDRFKALVHITRIHSREEERYLF